MRARALVLVPIAALLTTGAALVGAPTDRGAAPGDPRAAVLAVTAGFVTAMAEGDPVTACSLVSEESKSALTAQQGQTCESVMQAVQSARTNRDRYRGWVTAHPGVENVTITGQTAFVSYPPNSVAVLVADADGAWAMQSLN